MKKYLIKAAFGEKPERKPIWFLRQAGRYLPEYRKIRSKLEFLELCRTPKLAAEVTLQPLKRYDIDAAIIFSDILIPCTVMGQELKFAKDHGPILTNPVRSAEDLARLTFPDVESSLSYVGEALSLVKDSLADTQTLIGFAGAPFTVACYAIEGQGSKNYNEVKKLRYNDLPTFLSLLNFIADVTVDYLSMQVRAGADCLMLFDTWAGQLSSSDYRDHVFPVTNRIISTMRSAYPNVPVIYYPGQGSELLHEISGIAANVVAVDWRTRLDRAVDIFKSINLDVTVQGNLDPSALVGSEDLIRKMTQDVLDRGSEARQHIFNVGHGLLPHLNPDSLTWVIDEIRRWDNK